MGPIPDVSSSRNFSQLLLAHNSLSGTIPSTLFGPQLSYLSVIILYLKDLPWTNSNWPLSSDLSFNLLAGPLPDASSSPQLSFYQLSHNSLDGSINNITFQVPSSVLTLYVRPKKARLSTRHLSTRPFTDRLMLLQRYFLQLHYWLTCGL